VSLIPTTTGAAIATDKTIPELTGHMDAIAIRAPVPDGAAVNVVAYVKKDATVDSVNGAMKRAAEGELKGILEYTEEEIVSADIIHNPHSGIIDGLSTRVIGGRLVNVLTWYDNEWGYAGRMVDLASYMASKEK
ncbi:MAG TPA: type I glyceraldehyde-3-phosphate dehydrogenase, partial [Methanomicrobiales archaeon]|nr:type I glyceraldehyde-3-phosphate dehydrogenase [Methanomicrobiales archaeon]